MGSGTSTDAAGKFAGVVVMTEHENMKKLVDEGEVDAIDDVLLKTVLVNTYNKAIKEHNTPLLECKCSSVIAVKFGYLAEMEKLEFEELVINAISERSKPKKVTTENYEGSFGGTEADSKNEKEAAKLLRGEGAEEIEEETNVHLMKPTFESICQEKTLRKLGKWKRYLGSANCYLYFNCLTKDIVSSRPNDYIEEMEEVLYYDNIILHGSSV